MRALASTARLVRPITRTGAYWIPPGHVCPPPSTVTSSTSAAPVKPVRTSRVGSSDVLGMSVGPTGVVAPDRSAHRRTESGAENSTAHRPDRPLTSPPAYG